MPRLDEEVERRRHQEAEVVPPVSTFCEERHCCRIAQFSDGIASAARVTVDRSTKKPLVGVWGGITLKHCKDAVLSKEDNLGKNRLVEDAGEEIPRLLSFT